MEKKMFQPVIGSAQRRISDVVGVSGAAAAAVATVAMLQRCNRPTNNQ